MTETNIDIAANAQASANRPCEASGTPENLLSDDWSRAAADTVGVPLPHAPRDPRAAGYTRQARHDPTSTSHARQVAAVERYVAGAGLRMKTLYSDLGASGMARRGRPLFDAMMAEAREGGFRHVVVEDLDRLGRSFPDLLEVYEELCSRGIELHDVRHGRLDLTQVVVAGYLCAKGRARFVDRCEAAGRKAAVDRPARGPRKR